VHIEAAPAGAAAAAPAPRALRVGAVLSGGQAPGGHNVLSGIYDGIKRLHPDSVFIGFLDGPRGLFEGKYVEIDEAMMQRYRNMGGFDAIGSGRDKIETPEQFAGARAWADKLALDGVVIIGGDDSNTNGAVLAEYFKANGCTTKVVGAPKVRNGALAASCSLCAPRCAVKKKGSALPSCPLHCPTRTHPHPLNPPALYNPTPFARRPLTGT
jgi:diphosphate--fructose-6-phosphate 1-phosphotransferase